MRNRLIHCILFSLFCIGMPARAQDTLKGAGIGYEWNAFAGKVIKHTVKFHLPVPDVSNGMEFNINYQTFGRKDWEQRRKYPVIGLSITYINYGMDSVYGRCFGLCPNITLPLVRRKNWEWTLRVGDGIGYVTRTYDRTRPSDTLNNAIGSRINDFANFNTDVRWHINRHWDVQVGMGFNHISDASFHQPNLGINLYSYHVGVRYFPVSRTPVFIRRELPKLRNRWLVHCRMAMAFTQSDAPRGPLYPVYMASAYVSRRWISKNKFFGGLDYSYHKGVYAFLRNNEILQGQEAANSYKTAVFVGNEFLLGRIGVMLQMGYYLKQAALKQDIYYQKLGANCYIVQREKGPIKELFVTGLLKTHKTIAELAEFGVGIGF